MNSGNIKSRTHMPEAARRQLDLTRFIIEITDVEHQYVRVFDMEQGKFVSVGYAWEESRNAKEDAGKEFMCLTKFEASCLKHDSPSDAEEEDGEEEHQATIIMQDGKRRYKKLQEKIKAGEKKKEELAGFLDNSTLNTAKATDAVNELLQENLFLEQEKKKAEKSAELGELAAADAIDKLETKLLEAEFKAHFAEEEKKKVEVWLQEAQAQTRLAEERSRRLQTIVDKVSDLIDRRLRRH